MAFDILHVYLVVMSMITWNCESDSFKFSEASSSSLPQFCVHHCIQVHSFGVAQNDIKLENFLLANEPEATDLPTGRLQPSPHSLSKMLPKRMTRSQCLMNSAAAPAADPSSSTAVPGHRPRVVIIDFVRAECDASSFVLSQVRIILGILREAATIEGGERLSHARGGARCHMIDSSRLIASYMLQLPSAKSLLAAPPNLLCSGDG